MVMANFIVLHQPSGPSGRDASQLLVNLDTVEQIIPPSSPSAQVLVRFNGGDSVQVEETFDEILGMLKPAGAIA